MIVPTAYGIKELDEGIVTISNNFLEEEASNFSAKLFYMPRN